MSPLYVSHLVGQSPRPRAVRNPSPSPNPSLPVTLQSSSPFLPRHTQPSQQDELTCNGLPRTDTGYLQTLSVYISTVETAVCVLFDFRHLHWHFTQHTAARWAVLLHRYVPLTVPCFTPKYTGHVCSVGHNTGLESLLTLTLPNPKRQPALLQGPGSTRFPLQPCRSTSYVVWGHDVPTVRVTPSRTEPET